MTKNILSYVLEKLIKVCGNNNVRLVLMGGLATSIYSSPRTTYDIDGIVSLETEKMFSFLKSFKKYGFRFDAHKPIKFIAGLPYITFYYSEYKTYVDLFVSQTKFQQEILMRAKKIRFKKLNLFIISPEDLILVKLQTGREKDIEDVREIIVNNKETLDFIYLKTKAKNLGVYIFLKDELKSLSLTKTLI